MIHKLIKLTTIYTLFFLKIPKNLATATKDTISDINKSSSNFFTDYFYDSEDINENENKNRKLQTSSTSKKSQLINLNMSVYSYLYSLSNNIIFNDDEQFSKNLKNLNLPGNVSYSYLTIPQNDLKNINNKYENKIYENENKNKNTYNRLKRSATIKSSTIKTKNNKSSIYKNTTLSFQSTFAINENYLYLATEYTSSINDFKILQFRILNPGVVYWGGGRDLMSIGWESVHFF